MWTYSPEGDGDDRPDPHITIDHLTPTMSGSEVCVTRWLSGEIVLSADGERYEWSVEQCAAVEVWVDLLHRMPLEEIP